MVARLLIASLIVASAFVLAAPPRAVSASATLNYSLPFDNGASRLVSQGNNMCCAAQGWSHYGTEKYAWDFAGSWNVRASSGGTVTDFQDGFSASQGGCNSIFWNKANYVFVDTGTYQTLYLHLAQGSVISQTNPAIIITHTYDRYTLLGVSDSTGWVCGTNPAHLHYMVEDKCGTWYCQSEPSSFVDPNVLYQDSDGVPLTNQTVTSSNAQYLCTTPSLTSDPISPAMVGYPNSGNISFAGNTSGCPNPVYEFWVDPPGGSWTAAQLYSATSTFSWNSTNKPAGAYGFGVWVHDNSNPNAYDALYGFVFTLTSGCPTVTPVPSPLSPQTWGTTVIVYATNPGCPNPEYSFWILPPGGSWTMVKDYSTGTYNYLDVWNTAASLGGTYYPAGTYWVGAWVRKSGTAGTTCSSLGCFDAANSALYTLTPTPCTAVTASAAPTSVAHSSSNGQHVTITASPTCPNSNPQYEFWLRTDTTGWQLIQAYSTTATYDWNSTGASIGTVYFGVWVKDVSSSTSTFDANNPPTTVTVT